MKFKELIKVIDLTTQDIVILDNLEEIHYIADDYNINKNDLMEKYNEYIVVDICTMFNEEDKLLIRVENLK